MKYLLFFSFLFSFLQSTAQNANSIWVFGDSSGIDFRDTSNPVPIITGMDGRGSCASISDSTGNLQFYAYTQEGGNDWNTTVKNYLNDSVAGADSITGEGLYQEVIITPRPGFNNQYFLFSVGINYPNNNGLYCTLIDMNLNGGLGGVLYQNVRLDSINRGDCLSAVKHANGRDWWVITKLSNRLNDTYYSRFYVYLVTPDSISLSSVQDLDDGALDCDFQKITFKQNADTFMLINRLGYMGEYLFDRCGGVITRLRTVFPEQINNFNRYFWEGVYSPNGNVFYVTTSQASDIDSSYFIQYDLTAVNIPASADTVDAFLTPIGTGAVRLAPNGKVYFSRAYESPTVWSFPYADSMRNYINENLSVISNPDIVGAGCDYQPFSFLPWWEKNLLWFAE